MGLFNRMKQGDINRQLENYKKTPGAILLDVRETHEFSQGHIPGAVNLPGTMIQNAPSVVKKKETPIFAYCLSGARSSRAIQALKSMGYTNVTNMGGVNRYKGDLERG
ncbi:rhodanese-like domain-containing protein [Eubacterium oxidoreducens]|uniref:Rhodanese-related sulfurtransferase n=1 Tax=Eubacterium oxidoreducens TaxID=1732 RepID=A0A1G6AEP8_EUBOX|nr:rhodanese-like domain-containing protein [Eubacterium oxidoreducens]SDB06862.1 Rhodanese-related sulfurtransferase [Eubacterium oxidoreducens]